MRLEGFTHPVGVAGPDLGPKIAASIGKAIRDAGYKQAQAIVDGDITEADRAAIQAAINAYVYDPDYFLTEEQKRLKAMTALNQWAADAAVVAAQGANVSQAQLKLTIGRLGKLCAGLADLLKHMGVQ